MQSIRCFRLACALLTLVLITGCATRKPYDYSAFKVSDPKSILVLPPINNTPEISASNAVLSYTTRPLAESGYYVIPVTLAAETFKENGLTQANDIHATPIPKLREIFGADAGLYITISRYGTVYQVVGSASIVTATARLVDLKTGAQLWQGSASASSDEGNNQQGGLAVLLITAIVKQVVGSLTDESYRIAGVTTARLLSAGTPNGILFGPRSPHYTPYTPDVKP